MQPSAFLEASVIVILATMLLWPIRKLLRDIASRISRRYVLACAAGTILLLSGQLISNGEATYPFPDWNMYTASNPNDPQFIDYMAELSSGRQVRLLIAQLFPAGGKHFRARIDQAAYTAQQAGNSNDADLNAFLAAVTHEYDAHHPDDSIRVIRLWVGTIPARSYKGPDSISKQLLLEYHAP